MKPRLRQAQIAELVGQEGQMSVEDLAGRFAVSAETIRRDLTQLAETGAVQKVHGGARRLRLHAEGSFQERMTENAAAKRAIGAKVARMVEPGDTIFIDTGSTTLAAAEALAGLDGRLTVITNSVRIAQVFALAGARHAVFLLGGSFAPGNEQTVGPMALDQIGTFQADHALLTVAAIDAEAGASDADFDEARVARAMIDHARHVFILADASKFGRKAAFRVCPLDRIDVLVSDAAPEPVLRASLEAAGVECR